MSDIQIVLKTFFFLSYAKMKENMKGMLHLIFLQTLLVTLETI